MSAFIQLFTTRVLILILVAAGSIPGQTNYSWSQPHAEVSVKGDLKWKPQPFNFSAGNNTRYIDYENGSDSNDGKSKATPWKHHPWDPDAQANASEAEGAKTYVFKRGVFYRGSLQADESGQPGNPIRLTSDPAWGQGEAVFAGSVKIPAQWQKASSATAPSRMPEPEKVWYIDIASWEPLHPSRNPNRDWMPDGIFLVSENEVERIHIARNPDHAEGDSSYPHSYWPQWDGQVKNGVNIDSSLIGLPQDWFDGGTVISQWRGNMSTASSRTIKSGDFDPQAGSLKSSGWPVAKGTRYFIENLPQFLDSPGEYWFDEENRRIYLRLPGDKNPNQSHLEASRNWSAIEIADGENIEISGIRFSFNADNNSVIEILGHSAHIRVHHNTFSHLLNKPILAAPRPDSIRCMKIGGSCPKPWSLDTMSHIYVTDNDFYQLDLEAIKIADGKAFWGNDWPFGSLGHVEVLRNRVRNTSIRNYRSRYSAMPAVAVSYPQTGEVAGNIIIRSFGTGLMVHGGKRADKYNTTIPLTRIFVHHNKVEQTMLVNNDYGSISLWQGGPIYCYNNISGYTVGHKPETNLSSPWKTVAYPIYLDGAYKVYTFNNITWGKSNSKDDPYRNNGTYFMVFGFLNPVVNNTFHMALKGLGGSSGNRSDFLGNLFSEIKSTFISQNRIGDPSLAGGGDTGEMGLRGVPTLAYGNNLFHGEANAGSLAKGLIRSNDLEKFGQQMRDFPIRHGQLGEKSEDPVLQAPEQHDFRPRKNSQAIDNGVQYFIPWSLARTVGEWDFNRNHADPTVAIDYHYYMTPVYVVRHMYEYIPMFNLQFNDADTTSYIPSLSEDWTAGALSFDGSRFGRYLHQEMLEDVVVDKVQLLEHPQMDEGDLPGEPWVIDETEIRYPGRLRQTLDMDTTSVLMEVIVKITPGKRTGQIASKMKNGRGYKMGVNSSGKVYFEVASSSNSYTVSTSASLDDGRWHHVLAEMDREQNQANIYVNGKLDQTSAWNITKGASLTNTGDFLVGEGFYGALDFLRICKSTLQESKTTIEELYAWQTNGPVKYDFAGRVPNEGKRDIGALELDGISISIQKDSYKSGISKTLAHSITGGTQAGIKKGMNKYQTPSAPPSLAKTSEKPPVSPIGIKVAGGSNCKQREWKGLFQPSTSQNYFVSVNMGGTNLIGLRPASNPDSIILVRNPEHLPETPPSISLHLEESLPLQSGKEYNISVILHPHGVCNEVEYLIHSDGERLFRRRNLE